MLYLTEDDVRSLLTMEDTLRVLDELFAAWHGGKAVNLPRQRAPLPGSGTTLMLMGASVAHWGVLGYKAYTAGPAGTRFYAWLFDAEGRPLALMQADQLGRMRTGAASGVATRYMARREARVLGLYGTGWQAETQLLAVCAVRPIRRVQVFSRQAERRAAFCRRMEPLIQAEVVPVSDPRQAAAGADVVVTITSARAPVLFADWLEEGVHVNAAGSNHVKRRELEAAVIERCDRIVVDDVPQAQIECGDLLQVAPPGHPLWERVRPLSEIVAGAAPGRGNDREITLFESQGIAVEDVAVARHLLQLARARGVGRDLPIG